MKVSTEELQRAVSMLLQHLDKAGHKELDIAEDYYWDVPAERRYDPSSQPQELTLGQLSDDWTEVCRIIRGEREPLGYALVWLSSVLRRVGERPSAELQRSMCMISDLV